MASLSSEQPIRARAWLLAAEFDVAEHLQLANPATNHICPEYVRKCLDGRARYLAHDTEGMTLISLSLPTSPPFATEVLCQCVAYFMACMKSTSEFC
jgi:hypothetical protein